MQEDRAYTRIDAGTAYIGNAWLERSWSAFLGNTIGLDYHSASLEWLGRRNPEFAIELDEGVLGYMAFDEAEWFEASSPYGAHLVQRRFSDELALEFTTTAFHKSPGMLRSMRIHNLGGEPLPVRSVGLDMLVIAHRAHVRVNDLRDEHIALCWERDESAVALLAHGCGLLLGIEGGGVYDLFSGHPQLCALMTKTVGVLQPGEIRRLPDTWILPFSGEPEHAKARDYAAFLLLVKQWRLWEEERRRAASGEAAPEN
jgi:hypothetical protein